VPFDVSTLALTVALMAAAGVAASWAPARNASGKDPSAALKEI
jgi:ABC-type antimicrobial peptide transport system permease subunit